LADKEQSELTRYYILLLSISGNCMFLSIVDAWNDEDRVAGKLEAGASLLT